MRAHSLLVNDRVVETGSAASAPALDFIRGELGLFGTKEGCREGDCGACAVLLGEFVEGKPRYRAHPSCLMQVGELPGCHLITIEGIAEAASKAGLEDGLSPVMRALLEENGSQCGFCSPGFVVSLSAWLLEGGPLDEESAITAVEGNLCRCTGYASIRRAARILAAEFRGLPADPLSRIQALVARGVIPESALPFARGEVGGAEPGVGADTASPRRIIGGGTDLYVRDPRPAPEPPPHLARRDPRLLGIEEGEGLLVVGAAVPIRDFFASALVRKALPGVEAFERLFASILVRNRATIGGNIANASPVADMTSLLLALGASLRLGDTGSGGTREVALAAFFTAYKKIDLRAGEIIEAILVPPLEREDRFNYEKLSKRENLDIAAVNSGLRLAIDPASGRIARALVSAGGVAPVPRLLIRTAALLEGRRPDLEAAVAAAEAAEGEIEPIGDARGSADFRRRALGRLVLGHFARLFPDLGPGIARALAAKGGRP